MTGYTRGAWYVHIDVVSLGRDPSIAQAVATRLISDYTEVAVDNLEFIVSDDRLMVQTFSEDVARCMVQALDPVLLASRHWVGTWGHNVFACLMEEELKIVDGIGPVWIQRQPGRTFKKIFPCYLYSVSA